MADDPQDPFEGKRLRNRVVELEKRLAVAENHIKALAKGVQRAETSFEEWDGEILMEKTEIYGVAFDGPTD